MDRVRAGRILLIAAFALMIATSLVVKLMWFSRFGFQPHKLVSTLLSCALFYFAWRGSFAARWLTVAFAVLALVVGAFTELYRHDVGLLVIASTVVSIVLLCHPAVTSYQDHASGFE